MASEGEGFSPYIKEGSALILQQELNGSLRFVGLLPNDLDMPFDL